MTIRTLCRPLIEEAIRPMIFDAQQYLHNLRKAGLDRMINSTLLEQEAQKRKVTPQLLFETEVTPRVKKVTTADAGGFYEQNKYRIEGGTYEELESQIIQHVQGLEQRKAEEDFAGRLRAAASIKLFLAAPAPPVYSITGMCRMAFIMSNRVFAVLPFSTSCTSAGRFAYAGLGNH